MLPMKSETSEVLQEVGKPSRSENLARFAWMERGNQQPEGGNLENLKSGGRCRIRTCDFHRVKVALYR
jgi:hypothetical protein